MYCCVNDIVLLAHEQNTSVTEDFGTVRRRSPKSEMAAPQKGRQQTGLLEQLSQDEAKLVSIAENYVLANLSACAGLSDA